MKVVDVAHANVVKILEKIFLKERSFEISYKLSKWQKKWQEEYNFIQNEIKKINESVNSLGNTSEEEKEEFRVKNMLEFSNVDVDLEQLDFSFIKDSEISSNEILIISPLLKNMPND